MTVRCHVIETHGDSTCELQTLQTVHRPGIQVLHPDTMQPTYHEEPLYSIQELAELGGVSRRTVRYYVQRGLLSQPTGTGRGKHYTQTHLDTLLKIRALQEQGTSLDDIANLLNPDATQPSQAAHAPHTPVPSTWTRVELFEGVELHTRGRTLTSTQVAQLQRALYTILES